MSFLPVNPEAKVPAWFPPWAKELAELYFSRSTSMFLVHGNVHDLMACGGPNLDYSGLPEFLATQVFGSWDIVLHYDLARGLRPLSGSDANRLQGMVQYLTGKLGEPASWPRDPESVLLLLDRLIERTLLEEDSAKRKRMALLFDHAQYLVPDGDPASLARSAGMNLVRFLGWAQNPYIKRVNIAFCLLADRLADINDRLVHSPHVAAIRVPMPDEAARLRFIQWASRFDAGPAPAAPGLAPEEIASVSNGLTLVSLQVLLSQGQGRGVDAARFGQLKKTLIERECQGLLEFVEPRHTLDLVVGLDAAKNRLKQDAQLLSRGQMEVAPMGYLLCGPVGTGKTFLAECYAGSVGIPCVKLRNFRSKYVGETEGNLEQVLSVLRSLGPVVVIIDEADAALGTRQADGDSGTSSRVFAMIASQMGDTSYRGKIIWMLITSRPDMLPIDLKRQGRAEVHLPLFYPQSAGEVRDMFLAMAKKNRVSLATDSLPEVKPERRLSGADIEAIVLAARRQALASGRPQPDRADLQEAIRQFVPSAQGLEKEMQEIAAVLECSELHFLPQDWQTRMLAPEGRARLQERLVALRQLLRS